MYLRWLLFYAMISIGNAANILMAIPFSGRSHYIMLRPIALELARRGHNVTVMTAFAEKDPPSNYHQVVTDTKSIWDILGKRPNVFDVKDYSFAESNTIIQWKGNIYVTETIFNSSTVQEFLKKDNQFDLVICSVFYQESLMMLSHKYSAPLVLITTFGHSLRLSYSVRNPISLATDFHEIGKFTSGPSFLNRIKNLYYFLYEIFWIYVWYLPQQEALVAKYLPDLPKPIPSLREIQAGVSLILLNSHFTANTPRAYYPNVIEIGGIHAYETARTNSSLPKDLQNFIESAEHGVVYMSFGSNIKSKDLPKEKRKAFIKAFARLKQKVLWKWEDEEVANFPNSNVKVKAWMPQKEILAHPNVKVFISHGGLLGLQEATIIGIPILGMPIYFDQYSNILQVTQRGYGLMIDYNELTEDIIKEKLETLLNDEWYERAAKEVSKRFLDRPMTPMESAMFWIEYTIRHKGAEFIKNRSLSLNWIEWWMFDVYLFIAVAILACIFIVISFSRILLQIVSNLKDSIAFLQFKKKVLIKTD